MKRFALIVSLVAASAAIIPAATTAQGTQSGDATMLNSIPPQHALEQGRGVFDVPVCNSKRLCRENFG